MKALGCLFKGALWLIALVVAAVSLLLVTWGMWGNGVWPFEPLRTDHREMTLANGGTILIDGLEQQRGGLDGDGLLNYTCSYRPPGGDRVEDIGGYGAYMEDYFNPQFDCVGPLIVSSDGDNLNVRIAPGEWASYHMTTLPSPRETYAGTTLVGNNWWFLEPEEHARINAFIEDIRRQGWGASMRLVCFEPATRHVYIAFEALSARYMTLELAEDGTKFKLLELKNGEPPCQQNRSPFSSP